MLKRKIYTSKIKAAKSVVSNERSSHKHVNMTNHRQGRSQEHPLKKHGMSLALRKHGLQQYEKELQNKGYLDSPEKLLGLMQADRLTTLQSELKILPGHKTRLANMLHALDGRQPGMKLPLLQPVLVNRGEISSQSTIAKSVLDLTEQKTEKRSANVRIASFSPRGGYVANSLNLISSSSKQLRPAIKKAMARLATSKKRYPFQIQLCYKDHERSFRSMEGARMGSSLTKPDLSEMVECFANYVLDFLVVRKISKDRRRAPIKIDDSLFGKIKLRTDSFAQLVRDTTQTEVGTGIFNDISEQEPTISSISNYIRNLLTSCKFSVELLPVAAHYYQRLLNSKTIILTNHNFRRVVLSCLLAAYKMSDDQALNSKAGAALFTNVAEIAEIERGLLHALEYQLMLTPEQYSTSYFRLRNYVRKDAKTHRNIQAQRCHQAEYVPVCSMLSRDRLTPHRPSHRPKSF